MFIVSGHSLSVWVAGWQLLYIASGTDYFRDLRSAVCTPLAGFSLLIGLAEAVCFSLGNAKNICLELTAQCIDRTKRRRYRCRDLLLKEREGRLSQNPYVSACRTERGVADHVVGQVLSRRQDLRKRKRLLSSRT